MGSSRPHAEADPPAAAQADRKSVAHTNRRETAATIDDGRAGSRGPATLSQVPAPPRNRSLLRAAARYISERARCGSGGLAT